MLSVCFFMIWCKVSQLRTSTVNRVARSPAFDRIVWFLVQRLGDNFSQKWTGKKVQIKLRHTPLPSVGFRSWSQFLAVSLKVMWSHKPGCRLSLLSARPAVTLATLKTAAINFAAWWTQAQWVWAVCIRLLPDSVVAAIWTRALLRLSPAC